MLRLSVIIFRNSEGKILLQFRDSMAPSAPLGWSFFGGRAEGEETPFDNLMREIKEELNFEISSEKVRLLIEKPWISESNGEEKVVYLFEYITPIGWNEIDVREGAGAAFLSKEEIASLKGVSLFAKTFVADYC